MKWNDLSNLLSSESPKPTWRKNGGYLFVLHIYHFFVFKGNKKKFHKELDLENVVTTLLESTSDDISKDILDRSSELLRQQRLLENTRARKRLERWATNLIARYLVVVAFVLVFNSLSKVLFNLDNCLISDSIITVILSTTTINIIGLGIIVLKGHFEKADTATKEK